MFDGQATKEKMMGTSNANLASVIKKEEISDVLIMQDLLDHTIPSIFC